MKRITAWAVASGLAVVLAGCGGGGAERVADGGIGGTGISRGSITSFGSVVINARRFDTSGASFRLVGLTDAETALRVGLVTRIEGDLERAVAERVEFVPDAAGAVTRNAIDSQSGLGTLELVGQTVRVTASTVVDGAGDTGTAADFGEGTRVLVSGFRDSAGRIVASYVGSDGVPGSDHVAGTIDTVEGGGTFTIQGLTVDFSGAADGATFPGGSPSVGDRVRARGPVADGVMTAERVAPYIPVGGGRGDAVEVTGIIEDDSPGSGAFELDDELVEVGDGTVIAGGTVADLAEDARVLVLGARTGETTIRATRVEILPSEDVDIEAEIDGVDPAAGTVSLFAGALTVVTDARTRLRDDVGESDRLTLSALAPGDCVEIDGYIDRGDDGLDAGDPVIAVKLEREDDCDGEVELEGPVQGTDVARQRLTLLGLELDAPADRFEDGLTLDALSIGDIISVEWDDFRTIDSAPDGIERESGG